MKKKSDDPRCGRFYSLEVVVYATPDELIDVLSNVDFVSNYCMIYHDKDKLSDGSPAKEHTHCALTFSHRVSISYVSKRLSFFSVDKFTVNENQIELIKGTLQDYYDYILHRYEPTKYLYSSDLIRCTCPRLFKKNCALQENVAYLIICDIENDCSLRYMAKKYGRDFILHYTQYRDFCFDMKYQERGEQQGRDD